MGTLQTENNESVKMERPIFMGISKSGHSMLLGLVLDLIFGYVI